MTVHRDETETHGAVEVASEAIDELEEQIAKPPREMDLSGAEATPANIISGDDSQEPPETVTDTTTTAGCTVSEQACTDGGVTDTVKQIRATLDYAKQTEGTDRDQMLKAAAGELQWLNAREDVRLGEVKEQLMNAFAAPDEEVPYFINRTLDLLESTNVSEDEVNSPGEVAPAQRQEQSGDCVTAIEDPPECVRWTGDDSGILEVEVTRPLVEWIELEAENLGDLSVEEWVRIQIFTYLEKDLQDNHGPDIVTDIDLPEDYARRVGLWWKHQQMNDITEPGDLRDFLFNHMTVEGRWLLDGEPWTVAEDAGIGAHGSPSDRLRTGGDDR
jgi:hypothetical protein